jgi:hypothetical protein
VSGLWKSIRHPHLVVRLQLIVASSLLCLALLGGLSVYERYNQMYKSALDLSDMSDAMNDQTADRWSLGM